MFRFLTKATDSVTGNLPPASAASLSAESVGSQTTKSSEKRSLRIANAQLMEHSVISPTAPSSGCELPADSASTAEPADEIVKTVLVDDQEALVQMPVDGGDVADGLRLLPPDVLAIMWQQIKPLSETAVEELKRVANEKEGWELWEEKNGVRLEKKNCPSGVAGRAFISWKSEIYGFKEMVDYLWDTTSKEEYDEFALGMLRLRGFDEQLAESEQVPSKGEGKEDLPCGCHVVYQAFKGRFGVAGRDFVIVTRKSIEETDASSRLIIGAISVDEHIFSAEAHTEDEEALERYGTLKKGLVRGHAHVAGFDVHYDKKTKTFNLMYINEADIRTKGIPGWIVTRAKLDQLKIVKNIPPCIEKRLEDIASGKRSAK